MASTINASTVSGLVNSADTSGILQLQTASTAALTIDASQRVGIGTSTPTQLLQLEAAGNPCILLKDTTNNVQAYMFAGDVASYVGSANNYPVVFQVNDVENMRLNTNGALILKGGSTSASGVGIAFPATQSASSDANTLDDYEEGTWTPSIGGSTTYITQNGYYTKCGNVVTITGTMKINSQAGNANTYQITSLPFTAKTMTVAKAGCGAVGVSAGLAINVISLQTYVEPNTTNMVFTYSASASTSTLTAVIFGNNADVSFTTTYLTA